MATKVPSELIANNAVGITQLNVSDGSDGQVLTTDGSGTLSFSSVSGTTINNNADNRVITGSGTANTLEGEANFIFDGKNVGINRTSITQHATDVNTLAIQSDKNGKAGAIQLFSANDTVSSVIHQDTAGLALITNSSTSGTRNDIVFQTSSSEKLRITEAGNCGIGTTSPTEKLTVNGALAITGALADDRTSTAAMDFSSGVTRFVSYGASGTGGEFAFRTASGGASSTERMRLTATGLGIGTTSPAHRLEVKQNSATATPSLRLTPQIITKGYAGGNTYHSGIGFSMHEHTAGYWGSGILSHDDTGSYGNALTFYTSTGAASASPTEKMRLDTSGRLLVGTTSIGNASTNAKICGDSEFLSRGSAAGFFWENRTGMTIASQSGWGGWYSTGTASQFLYSDGANRASIGRTSGTYTALSDVNKKKDFEDSTVGLAEVMQLKPKKFRMLEDADDAPKKLGFVAQDVENVIPEAYVEDLADDENEETFIGLTDTPIIAALTKAIQEQQTIIDDLKTRIETLEGE